GCFFQAEDGIRRRTVTGVQTCALPISTLWLLPLLTASAQQPAESDAGGAVFLLVPVGARAAALGQAAVADGGSSESAFWNPAGRSEERRVGKEWKMGGGQSPLRLMC